MALEYLSGQCSAESVEGVIQKRLSVGEQRWQSVPESEDVVVVGADHVREIASFPVVCDESGALLVRVFPVMTKVKLWKGQPLSFSFRSSRESEAVRTTDWFHLAAMDVRSSTKKRKEMDSPSWIADMVISCKRPKRVAEEE